MAKRLSFFGKIRQVFLLYVLFWLVAWSLYYIFWGRHLYLVTAYCNCPICVNVKKYQDSRFANGKKIHWGGIAADPAIRFGTRVDLVPFWPQDWATVLSLLKGRRKFTVEDRGGKIKGKHIDIFIPDSMGGHQTAKNWGVRRMRIKLNGEWAE